MQECFYFKGTAAQAILSFLSEKYNQKKFILHELYQTIRESFGRPLEMESSAISNFINQNCNDTSYFLFELTYLTAFFYEICIRTFCNLLCYGVTFLK